MSENHASDRKRFFDAYEAIIESKVDELATPPAITDRLAGLNTLPSPETGESITSLD
jgi:hypothetical protein